MGGSGRAIVVGGGWNLGATAGGHIFSKSFVFLLKAFDFTPYLSVEEYVSLCSFKQKKKTQG